MTKTQVAGQILPAAISTILATGRVSKIVTKLIPQQQVPAMKITKTARMETIVTLLGFVIRMKHVVSGAIPSMEHVRRYVLKIAHDGMTNSVTKTCTQKNAVMI